MPAILCSEGKIVEASGTQGIDFGGVTSCMTITCILNDGTKVAAHDAIWLRVAPHIFKAILGKINSRKITKVIAAGAGSCWTPQMNSQQNLSDTLSKNDPNWAKRKWDDQLEEMKPFLVSGNTDKFKQVLAWHFNVSVSAVEYHNYDFGRIQIGADGTPTFG